MARIRSVEQLRHGLGEAASGYSDEELVQAWAAATGKPLPVASARLGLDTPSGPWTEQGSASIDSYQAGMLGLAEAAGGASGLSGLQDWAGRRRRANEIRAAISTQRAAEGGIPQSYEDVNGVGSALRYVGGLAVQSAPYLAEAAVGGAAGRLIGGGLRGAEGLRGAWAAGTAGDALAGGAVASYPSSVADVLQNQREQAGVTNLGTAAALGVPYAALNAVPGLEAAAATGKVTRVGIHALDDMRGVRGGLARMGANAGLTGVSEGLNELGQEGINQLGRMSVDPNASLFEDAALKRYMESFVGGAVLGGAVGGAAGGWKRSSPMAQPLGEQESTPPAQDIDVLQLGYKPLAGTPVVFPDGTVALSGEQELAYRTDPQPADMIDYPPTSALEDNTPRLGYSPLAGVPIVYPDGSIALPGDIENQPASAPIPQLGATYDALSGETKGYQQPTGLALTQDETSPYFPQQVAQQPDIDTGGLTYEGEYSPVSFPGPLPADVAGGVRSPAVQAGPIDMSAPLQEVQQQATGQPRTTEGAQQLALTQERRTRAEEALGRAREAGMQSEKQQEAFWRAEELSKEGKLPESKMTQVIALLLQNKHGRVGKILDEAALQTVSEVPPVSTSTQLESVPVQGDRLSAGSAQQVAVANITPTIEAQSASVQKPLVEKVKEAKAKAQKLKRYETLLACLMRASK